GQVVVRAGLQASYLVVFGVLGRQHQHGRDAELAKSPGDFTPVQPGHHDVQNIQVRLLRLSLAQHARTVGDGHDAIVGNLQVALDELQQTWVVIGDEDG